MLSLLYKKRESIYFKTHIGGKVLMLGVIIVLAIAIVLALAIFAIINYHQMLMHNEINKRLLLLTQESLERERITKEEQQEALIQLAMTTEANVSRETSDAAVISDDESDANFFSNPDY